MRFFISYSRAVRTDVSRLVGLLEAKGHEVWWDAEIPPGQAWWATILDKIEWCEVFVFVVSEKSVQSPYCLAELKYATDRNRPILPFIIDPPASYIIPAAVTPKLNQWLPYEGSIEEAAQEIITAAAGLDQSLYADLPSPRPPEPGKDHKTLTNQFQQALTLADEGHFEEALKHLREVDALDHKAWGELCRLWMSKIVAYQEIADLSDHPGTRRMARTHWNAYKETYQDEDGLFDPLNIEKMLAPTAPIAAVPAEPTPIPPAPAPVPAQGFSSTRTLNSPWERLTRLNLMRGVSILIVGIVLLLVALSFLNPKPSPDDFMDDRSIAMATQDITPGLSEQDIDPLASDTPAMLTNTGESIVDQTEPTQPLPIVTDMMPANGWAIFEQEFDGVTMVLVPAGCFMMGGGEFEDEQPESRQCLEASIWIDKYEVTNAQFAQFGGSTEGPSTWTEDDRPRESLTWFEARDFCALRGARLPTEREWEFAARGPDNRLYPWGNDWDESKVVWHGNSTGVTMPVGSFPDGASWVGAVDMSGNVWEWVSTIYGIETQGDSDFDDIEEQVFRYPYAPDDGREQDSEDASYGRVFRGGSWMSAEPNNLRAAYRGWLYPNEKHDYIGFRCARSN